MVPCANTTFITFIVSIVLGYHTLLWAAKAEMSLIAPLRDPLLDRRYPSGVIGDENLGAM